MPGAAQTTSKRPGALRRNSAELFSSARSLLASPVVALKDHRNGGGSFGFGSLRSPSSRPALTSSAAAAPLQQHAPAQRMASVRLLFDEAMVAEDNDHDGASSAASSDSDKASFVPSAGSAAAVDASPVAVERPALAIASPSPPIAIKERGKLSAAAPSALRTQGSAFGAAELFASPRHVRSNAADDTLQKLRAATLRGGLAAGILAARLAARLRQRRASAGDATSRSVTTQLDASVNASSMADEGVGEPAGFATGLQCPPNTATSQASPAAASAMGLTSAASGDAFTPASAGAEAGAVHAPSSSAKSAKLQALIDAVVSSSKHRRRSTGGSTLDTVPERSAVVAHRAHRSSASGGSHFGRADGSDDAAAPPSSVHARGASHGSQFSDHHDAVAPLSSVHSARRSSGRSLDAAATFVSSALSASTSIGMADDAADAVVTVDPAVPRHHTRRSTRFSGSVSAALLSAASLQQLRGSVPVPLDATAWAPASAGGAGSGHARLMTGEFRRVVSAVAAEGHGSGSGDADDGLPTYECRLGASARQASGSVSAVAEQAAQHESKANVGDAATAKAAAPHRSESERSTTVSQVASRHSNGADPQPGSPSAGNTSQAHPWFGRDGLAIIEVEIIFDGDDAERTDTDGGAAAAFCLAFWLPMPPRPQSGTGPHCRLKSAASELILEVEAALDGDSEWDVCLQADAGDAQLASASSCEVIQCAGGRVSAQYRHGAVDSIAASGAYSRYARLPVVRRSMTPKPAYAASSAGGRMPGNAAAPLPRRRLPHAAAATGSVASVGRSATFLQAPWQRDDPIRALASSQPQTVDVPLAARGRDAAVRPPRPPSRPRPPSLVAGKGAVDASAAAVSAHATITAWQRASSARRDTLQRSADARRQWPQRAVSAGSNAATLPAARVL